MFSLFSLFLFWQYWGMNLEPDIYKVSHPQFSYNIPSPYYLFLVYFLYFLIFSIALLS